MPTALSQEQIEARLRIVEEHMRAENAHDVTAAVNPSFPFIGPMNPSTRAWTGATSRIFPASAATVTAIRLTSPAAFRVSVRLTFSEWLCLI